MTPCDSRAALGGMAGQTDRPLPFQSYLECPFSNKLLWGTSVTGGLMLVSHCPGVPWQQWGQLLPLCPTTAAALTLASPKATLEPSLAVAHSTALFPVVGPF